MRDSPAASRNSSIPNETPFRIWIVQKVRTLPLVPPSPHVLLTDGRDALDHGVDVAARLLLHFRDVDRGDHLPVLLELAAAAWRLELGQGVPEGIAHAVAVAQITLEIVEGLGDQLARHPAGVAVAARPRLEALVVLGDEGLVLRIVERGRVRA